MVSGDVQRLLRERARRLAVAPAPTQRGALLAVLVCRVGKERYAIELDALRAIQPATGLTRVPCTPPFVAGILNVRGEILSVLDLAAALGLGGPPTPLDGSHVLIVEAPPVRVGLLVDEALGIERLALDALDRPLAGSEFGRGVSGAALVLLGIEQLVAGGRFDVVDEVG